jgi:metal-responsive CopG/Arc/MetJ family transcriptional regulator
LDTVSSRRYLLLMKKDKTLRVHITIPESEVAAIDDWRYAHRIPNRAQAIRLLIQRSLDAENAAGKQAKDPDK